MPTPVLFIPLACLCFLTTIAMLTLLCTPVVAAFVGLPEGFGTILAIGVGTAIGLSPGVAVYAITLTVLTIRSAPKPIARPWLVGVICMFAGSAFWITHGVVSDMVSDDPYASFSSLLGIAALPSVPIVAVASKRIAAFLGGALENWSN